MDRLAGSEATTARIAEMLLLVDAYEQILRTDIDTLLLLRHAESRWEDDLLVATATQLGKGVIEIPESGFLVSRWFGLAPMVQDDNHRWSAIVPQRTQLWWRRWQLLAQGFWSLVTYPFVRRGDKARNVQQIPAMLRQYHRSRNIIRATADLCHGDELTYRGVDLAPFLKKLAGRFTRYELLERIALFHGLSHFLEVNHTLIVRTSDFGMLPLGAICQHLLTELEMRRGEHRPLLFCAAGVPLDRYLPVQTDNSCHLILVAGEHDRTMTSKRGTASDNMVVGGCMRAEEVRQFAGQIRPEDSAMLLDIGRSEACNILYASPGVSRGSFSLQELRRTAVYRARLAREHPEATIIVQPHSGEEAKEWRRVVSRFAAPPNLHLVSHAISTHHCINFCDLLVTKVSALAFDAMELGKPVVAVSLDGDKRSLETYGEAVREFGDLGDLDAFLQYLLSDSQHLAVWRDTAIAKQNEFLRGKIFDPGEPVARYMVDRVIALLGNEMTLRKTIRRHVPERRGRPAHFSIGQGPVHGKQ